MTTYCKNCGIRASEGARYCAGCGEVLPKEIKMLNKDTLGKDMAKAAAIGAVIAIPVPFVGPVLGAAAGAGYAWYKAKKRG